MQSSMTTQVSSFQKKSKTQVPSIVGSKLSVQNAQLLVSTGVPSLDNVIGGGIAVGTIILIEEDIYASYSKVLLKYFLSEGVVCRHSLLVASKDRSPGKIVSGLPGLAGNEESTPSNAADEKLAIAWRYQNLKTVPSSPSTTAFGHHFDLTTNIAADLLEATDIHYWPNADENIVPDSNFHDAAFCGLLSRVRSVVETGGFMVNASPAHRNVLRVAVDALGSPLWESDGAGSLQADLPLFLYSLRGILRSAYAAAMVTIPALLAEEAGLLRRCRHLVDTSVRLDAWAGGPRAAHPLLRDLHGLAHITKMAATNCLPVAATASQRTDLGFKLRRKKFLIEKLHLPPELQDSAQREQDDVMGAASGGGCGGGGGNSQLDF